MRKDTKEGPERASTPQRESNWWGTVPGMLTAIAGVLTALAGLVAALHQVGLIGEQKTTPASRPAPAQASTAAAPSAATLPEAGQSSAQTAPAGRSAAAVRAHDGGYSVVFPSGTEVKFRNHRGAGTYKVLAAIAERRSSAKLNLKFTIRLTNGGPADVGFWNDSFRLLVDGVPRAPVGRLNDSVSVRSAKDADIEFEVPDTAKEFRLQVLVGDNDETADIPLVLSSVQK
jgi:hypothetical protein